MLLSGGSERNIYTFFIIVLLNAHLMFAHLPSARLARWRALGSRHAIIEADRLAATIEGYIQSYLQIELDTANTMTILHYEKLLDAEKKSPPSEKIRQDLLKGINANSRAREVEGENLERVTSKAKSISGAIRAINEMANKEIRLMSDLELDFAPIVKGLTGVGENGRKA